MMRRATNLALGVLAVGPAALMAYQVFVLSIVGHWPRYGQPDPKLTETPIAHAATGLAAAASCAAFSFLALSVPLLVRNSRAEQWHRTVVPVLAALGVFAAWFLLDPTGGIEWNLD